MRSMTLIAMACSMLCGCAPAAESPEYRVDIDTRCEDPRPEMCTREYLPVCALRDTGVRCVTTPCPSIEWKTYGNACDACADADVIGHVRGACEN